VKAWVATQAFRFLSAALRWTASV